MQDRITNQRICFSRIFFNLNCCDMKKLIIVRHAKAEDATKDIRDFDRYLTKKGVLRARLIGEFLKKNGVTPEYVAVSPALRARQTAEQAIKAFSPSPFSALEMRLYLAGEEPYFDILTGIDSPYETAMIVGHEPDITDFFLTLSEPSEDNQFCTDLFLQNGFPKAGALVFEFPVADWRRIKPHTGRVSLFYHHKKAPAEIEE